MNRILHWLVDKLAHPISTRSNKQGRSDYEERDDSNEDVHEPVTGNEEHTNMDEIMPDIYGESTDISQSKDNTQSDEDTQPDLEIIEAPSPSSERSKGFDPYNSGDFKFPKK